MKKIFSIVGLLTISTLALVGCSVEEEQPQTVPSVADQNDIKNFEQETTIIVGPDGTITKVADEGNASVSSGNKGNKADVKLTNTVLINSAQFLEMNKSKDGYGNENEYSLGQGASIKAVLIRELSSPKSFCLLGTSLEDDTINVYYDSQTKSIVPEGQTCKDPIGEHWEPRTDFSRQ